MKSGAVDLLEQRRACAFALAKLAVVQTFEEFFDGVVQFANREELPMPKCGQYPAFDNADGVLDFGFVTRLARPCGHHRDAVMLGHLVIRAIEIRLVPASSRHSGPRVVRNQ